jgi:DNA-binding response OmpR family regulator
MYTATATPKGTIEDIGTRILVVDDDQDILGVLQDRLQALGYAVSGSPDGQAALEELMRGLPDLLFLDIEMPRMKGLELLRHIRTTWSELPVIIMTAHSSISLAVQAMKEGANDFITKPLDFRQLGRTIEKALERKELSAEVAKLMGEISHEVKNLLQPMVCGTDLLESEIGDLLKQLPTMEAAKAEESHRLCDELIGMLRNTTQRMQDRMKGIADYVNLMRAPLTFGPCKLADVVGQSLIGARTGCGGPEHRRAV